MCGIFGVVYADASWEPDLGLLQRSAALLRHRGPDGSGCHRQPGIGLAHTRLSLLDLDHRSDQPLWDPQGRYGIVYNGEIYNFLAIRADLEARGLRFRTTSDTEVLLLSLIADGPEATVARLRGMYAFAFIDTLEGSVVLARDRFGIKPLFLYRDSRQTLFASEVKAFGPWVALRPNPFQMIRYLMHFGQPVRGSSFFTGVEIVPPGSLIRLKAGIAPEVTMSHDLTDMVDPGKMVELNRLSDEEVVDHLDALLQSSVEGMLVADAPVGALCSGGVDSSLLMAMAAKRHANLAIFHADVVGPLSERDAATKLAKHLGLDLHTVEVRDDDIIESTAEGLYHYEQPFAHHPHSVPFLLVSKLVRQKGVKAVLTGEGADECFLGYGRLAQKPLWDFYDRQVNRLAHLVRRTPVIGDQLWPNTERNHTLVGQMLGQFQGERQRQGIRQRYRELTGELPRRNADSLEQLTYHLRTLLHRNDTMGMATSIEARFPLLDENLVATAINLPYRHKIRFDFRTWDKEHPLVRDKWILRRVADRYLPRELSRRSKRGFPVSAYRRMKVDRGLFKRSFLADCFELGEGDIDLLLDGADAALQARLVMLEAWGQIFFAGHTPDAEREKLTRHLNFGEDQGQVALQGSRARA